MGELLNQSSAAGLTTRQETANRPSWGWSHIDAHFPVASVFHPRWVLRAARWLRSAHCREIIIRTSSNLVASCKTADQLLSLPAFYFAPDSSYRYFFGPHEICVDERRTA